MKKEQLGGSDRTAYVGVALNVVVIGLLFRALELEESLAWVPWAFVAANVLALALVLMGFRKPGALLLLFASVVALPMGFVAMVGAIEIFDRESERKFDGALGTSERYLARPGIQRFQFTLGLVCLGLALLIMLFSTSGGALAAAGLLSIGSSRWYANCPIAVLYDNYFVFKNAPLSQAHMAYYQQIRQIERTGSNQVVVQTQESKLTLALGSLDEPAKERVLRSLIDKWNAAAPKAQEAQERSTGEERE